jgi:hypothetical protein
MNLPSNVEFTKVNSDGSCEIKFLSKPSFMYISFCKENGTRPDELIYLNGKWVRNWQSIELESSEYAVPTLRLEFNL